jgi:hypothetical protein
VYWHIKPILGIGLYTNKNKKKQNKTNHKQTNETRNNKLEIYMLFSQLFFVLSLVLFCFTIHYTPFSLLPHWRSSIYVSPSTAQTQLSLFLLSDSAKAMLQFRELLSPTFSLLTPTHFIPSLPYSLSMFSFSPYIFTILRPSSFSVDVLLFFSYRLVSFCNRYTW